MAEVAYADKGKAELKYAPLKLMPEKKGGSEVVVAGEASVQEALSSVAAKKLVTDVAAQADMLVGRASSSVFQTLA